MLEKVDLMSRCVERESCIERKIRKLCFLESDAMKTRRNFEGRELLFTFSSVLDLYAFLVCFSYHDAQDF